jgi:diguanylate cyclase (GGDEF)-like protein/PAS domain S-box-containing protein
MKEFKHTAAETVSNDLYEAAARRFEALFDGIPMACLTFDRDGVIFEWNKASEDLWELHSKDAFLSRISQALRAPTENLIKEAVARVFSGESLVEMEWRAEFGDGRHKWVVANAFPIQSPDGRITGGIMACMDITARKALQEQVEAQLLEISQARILVEYQRDQLAEANAKLEDLATTDGLTGLRNHRSFQEFFERQFLIAKRAKDHLSLVLLDVDHFKLINDEFGHPAGDEILRQLSKILEDMGRKSDFIARYGGEEFVVVLPDTDAQGALEAAERFRKAVEEHDFEICKVTASFGCATMDSTDASHHDIVSRADQALYASKRAGRNRVTHLDLVDRAA